MYKVTIDGLSSSDAHIVVSTLYSQGDFESMVIEGGSGDFFSFRVTARTQSHRDAQDLVDTMRSRNVDAKYEEI